MRLKVWIAAACAFLAFDSMARAQSVVPPASTHPTCIYGNRIKGVQKKFPCRVLTNGVGGDVIFIDEYSEKSLKSAFVARHGDGSGWYAPRLRNNQCLLRRQGAEYICLGPKWSGI